MDRQYLLFWALIFFSALSTSTTASDAPVQLPLGVVVDLRSPEYSDGVLTTTRGGVISAGDMRIQAQKISYLRKVVDSKVVSTIVAEGDLLVEYGDYFFVGCLLEYDFENKSGVILQGRSFVDPWFFGGDRIALHSDGSYSICSGYLTTDPSRESSWKIGAEEMLLCPNRDFNAKNLKFKIGKQPLLWLPTLRGNINTIADAALRYSFSMGRQGVRFGIYYQLLSWRRFSAFLRFDYRLNRGPAGGIETRYSSEDGRESFEAINYLARDSAADHPHQQLRYRFQGTYENHFFNDRVSLNASYDKLSDKEMASDYRGRSLKLEYPGMTMLHLRRQERNWICNLRATVRLNSFQTVNQQLPTLELTLRPFVLGSTSIISDCRFSASYLEFKYANDVHCANDYCSTRFSYTHRLYRQQQFGPINITPEIAALLIYYGNVPKENRRWLTLGIANCTAQLPLYRLYTQGKHLITPYAVVSSYSYPTSPPRDHFIFDINDGWFRLNMVRFGMRHDFYIKRLFDLPGRSLALDCYANGFINCRNMPRAIPKVYLMATLFPTLRVKYTLDTAWDCQRRRWDHLNLRAEWSHNSNFACSAEYRHRTAFDWRKADRDNFFLDAFRSERELLRTPLSDRRDTVLLHLFWRMTPSWAVSVESRQGWQRRHEPSYSEYGIDLIGRLQSAWRVKLSYQHREDDAHRFVIHFKLLSESLDYEKSKPTTPTLQF